MVKKSCKKCKKNPKRKCSCRTHGAAKAACCRKGDHIHHGSSKVSVRVIVPQQASAPAQLPDFGTYQEQNRLSFAEIHQLIKKIEPMSLPTGGSAKSPIGKVEQQTQTNIPNIFVDKGAAGGLGASPRKAKVMDEFTPSPPARRPPVVPTYHTNERIRDIVNRYSVEPESPRADGQGSSQQLKEYYHPEFRRTILEGKPAYIYLKKHHELQEVSPTRSKLNLGSDKDNKPYVNYFKQFEKPDSPSGTPNVFSSTQYF